MITRFRVPACYLCDLRLLRWADIAWGVGQGLLTYGDVVVFSLCRVDEESSLAEFALAALDPEDEWAIERALEKVVAEEGSQVNDSAARWLFALLLHGFETAATVEALIEFVDEIYCDFRHPEEMYNFVSWIPPLDGYDPTKHTLEENRRELVRLLYDYLSRTAATFGVRAPASYPR